MTQSVDRDGVMSPPSRVQVGHMCYDVVVDKQRADDAGVTYGQSDHSKCTIVLNPDQHAHQMRDTVLHEVLHAICDQLGVNKGGAAALLDFDAEERLVSSLSPILLDTLRRNPHLHEYLLRPDGPSADPDG